jgi:hypothetical protein
VWWNKPAGAVAAIVLMTCAAHAAVTGAAAAGDGPGSMAADMVSAARVSVCAELKVLDGGPLSHALGSAAARGVRLRLILDPAERSTRVQGRALLAGFQSVSLSASPLQLRWLRGAGSGQRRVLADQSRLLRWRVGQTPQRLDAQAVSEAGRFERRWALAMPVLPELQTLDDDLKALPDPRENDPRIVQRREASGE